MRVGPALWALALALSGCVVQEAEPGGDGAAGRPAEDARGPAPDLGAADQGEPDGFTADAASDPALDRDGDTDPEPTPPPDDVPPDDAPPAPWAADADPQPHVARPLDVICLDARDLIPQAEYAGHRWTFHWRTAQRPRGSTARWVEALANPARPAAGGPADDPATPTACHFLDLAGAWRFELLARADAQAWQRAATVLIQVIPSEDLHVQLVWDTPDDADQTDDEGTDVDLHLRHPLAEAWAQAPLDCHFANTSPDWGPAGPQANPSLDIDDVNGAGPENINLDAPEDTAALGAGYRVGVHYYRSEHLVDGGPAGSLATVRIFLGGVLAGEFERWLPSTDNLWEVAEIHWEEGLGRVVPIDAFHEDINGLP